jgi:hypothetical protein
MKNPQQNPRKIDSRLVATVAIFFLKSRQSTVRSNFETIVDSMVNFWLVKDFSYEEEIHMLFAQRLESGPRNFIPSSRQPTTRLETV